jgi:hypothetical protein
MHKAPQTMHKTHQKTTPTKPLKIAQNAKKRKPIQSTTSHLHTTTSPHKSLASTTSTTPERLQLQQKRFKKKQREKTLYITGPFYDNDNNALPVLTGVDYFDDKDPEMAQQYKNTYSKHFQVPCLLSSESTRDEQTRAINNSGNKILSTLRHHLNESKKNNKKFFLADLPPTPNFSQEPNKFYENDPDEYRMPSNQYVSNNTGHSIDSHHASSPNPTTTTTTTTTPKTPTSHHNNSVNSHHPHANWGQILQVKTDMMDLWSEYHPGKSPSNMGSYVSGDTLAVSQTTRVIALIQNRIKNPLLFQTFGLDESVYHTRLTMYAIHVWLYCRSVQYRPVYHGPSYREFLIKALDSTSEQALYYDFRFLNGKDRHSMIQALLPWYRSFMINLDKSFNALSGGDPEPLYGILYRALYRPNEANRHDPSKTDPLLVNSKAELKGFPYSPDLEVFMQDPPSLTHMNNFINYIVNVSYDFQTKSPRDYTMLLNGYMDIVDFKHYTPQHVLKKAKVVDDEKGVEKIDEKGVEKIEERPQPISVGSPTPPELTLNTDKPHVTIHAPHQPGNKPLLKKITPDEMMRWCYPVYQAQRSPYVPGFFKRMFLRVSPPKVETGNWFLNPRSDQNVPSWRPPTCSLTISGRKE